MLYLNDKIWDKKEWEIELAKHFDPKKNKKKEFIFNLVDKFRGYKKLDNKVVSTWPVDFNYVMAYTFTYKGEDVNLRYATTPSRNKPGKDGIGVVTHDADKIIFDNGVLRVDSKHLDLYFFLLMSPNNYTNPTYYKEEKGGALVKDMDKWPLNGNFMFKEKNDDMEKADAYDQSQARFEAESYIFNGGSRSEIEELYVLYEGGTKADASEAPLKTMKNFLLDIARNNPGQFLQDLDSSVRTIKGKIIEAVEAGVIHFDFRSGWWKWSGEVGGKIIQVAKGQDPNNALLRFVNEKDSGAFLTALEGKVIEAEQDVEGDNGEVVTETKKPRGWNLKNKGKAEEN